MSEYSVKDILNSWAYSLNEDLSTKYAYKAREEHLHSLAKLFKHYEVSFDDASTYSVREYVLKALTTKEGRKGKGKHKDWPENVKKDFDEIIASYYIPIPNELDGPKENPDVLYIPKDEKITKWVKDKYGESSILLHEAHNPFSLIYLNFLNDNFMKK